MELQILAIPKKQMGLIWGGFANVFKMKRSLGKHDIDFDKLAVVVGKLEFGMFRPFNITIPNPDTTSAEKELVVGTTGALRIYHAGMDSATVAATRINISDARVWTILPKRQRLKLKPKISYANTPHFPVESGPVDIIGFEIDNELDLSNWEEHPKGLPKPPSKPQFGKPPPHFHKPRRNKTFVEPPKKR